MMTMNWCFHGIDTFKWGELCVDILAFVWNENLYVNNSIQQYEMDNQKNNFEKKTKTD